jgi:hypothetical protein
MLLEWDKILCSMLRMKVSNEIKMLTNLTCSNKK